MVSLFQIGTQANLWRHLSTGVPTLDQMLNLQSNALFDFQSVPGNVAVTALLCNMIVSHLSQSDHSRVVVLETLNTFPWAILKQHQLFEARWNDEGRISCYNVSSFAKMYAYFAFNVIERSPPGSLLLLVLNFHESVELYKLQMAATYEELLLQHQIDKNRSLLHIKDKIMEEGISSADYSNLSPKSSLLRENPLVKAQKHINGLFSMMADLAFKHSAVIILLGHLEPKFKPYSKSELSVPTLGAPGQNTHPRSSSPPPSASPSSRESARLVLTPITFGSPLPDKPSLPESKLWARVVFYKDWYHKSFHFQKEETDMSSDHWYLVSVAKVYNLSGVPNINEPVYFDFLRTASSSSPMSFIDLSEPNLNSQEGGEDDPQLLTSMLQSSIASTQLRDSVITNRPKATPDSSPQSQRRHKLRRIAVPSSPTLLHSNVVESDVLSRSETEHQDAVPDEDEPSSTSSEMTPLSSQNVHSVIEGSDVESTGTLLEDLEDNEPDWLLRHI